VIVNGPTLDGIEVVQANTNVLALFGQHVRIKCAPKNGDLMGNVVAGLVQNNEFAQRCIDDSFLFAEVSERCKALLGSRV